MRFIVAVGKYPSDLQELMNNPPTGYQYHSWNVSGDQYGKDYVVVYEKTEYR